MSSSQVPLSLFFAFLLLSNLTSRRVASSFSQSFGQDSQLTPFLPQYRGLSHLWLAVEAHCFSSGTSSQPLLRHASESAKSFRSALTVDPPVEATKLKSPLVATNRQPKERPARRPVRGAALATTTAKGKAAPAGRVAKSEYRKALTKREEDGTRTEPFFRHSYSSFGRRPGSRRRFVDLDKFFEDEDLLPLRRCRTVPVSSWSVAPIFFSLPHLRSTHTPRIVSLIDLTQTPSPVSLDSSVTPSLGLNSSRSFEA